VLLQAARGAVVKRLEWLDSNFLAALNAYLTLPSVQADDDLLALLTAVRHEVLDLVRPDGSTVFGCKRSRLQAQQQKSHLLVALSESSQAHRLVTNSHDGLCVQHSGDVLCVQPHCWVQHKGVLRWRSGSQQHDTSTAQA
jgi:hypothetical protein